MKMLTLFYKRIAFWLQWSLGQRPEHKKDKQSCKEQNRPNFRDTNKPLISNRSRHYGVEYIQIMPGQNYYPGHDNKPIDPFKITVHQQEYWEQKVHGHHSKKWQIEIRYPGYVIRYFFRNIGIPDQHKLGEP